MIWNPNPIAIQIGSYTMPWYGVLFAIGLVVAILYCYSCAKAKSYPQSWVDELIIACFLGIFLGARLAHCLFYEPNYYFHHPLEILLPIKQVAGMYVYTGYCGLASHGAAAGIIIAFLFFKLHRKTAILPLLDIVAISVPLGGAFIRLGNFMNSEIVGAVTDMPWGIIFPVMDELPRHPAQLYESAFYFGLFCVMAFLYKKFDYKRVRGGFWLAVVTIAISIFRFCVEFFKEVQSGFEKEMVLNMGQILSIPFFVFGVVLLIITCRKQTTENITENN